MYRERYNLVPRVLSVPFSKINHYVRLRGVASHADVLTRSFPTNIVCEEGTRYEALRTSACEAKGERSHFDQGGYQCHEDISVIRSVLCLRLLS